MPLQIPFRKNFPMKFHKKLSLKWHYGGNYIHKRPSINYVSPKGGGGLAEHYYWIFLLYKSIRILTESVTWGRGGVKNCQFWRNIIYGWPLITSEVPFQR